MIRIAIIVGTRPEIIKMASIIKKCRKARGVETILVHTGQHYDWNMGWSFLRELDLPNPTIYLKAGSGIAQFPNVVARATKILSRIRPDVVLVEGDTNSAAGAALASNKLGIPVGHVEAGCRSFDRRMQEEINRMVIADLADANFVATKACRNNLLREGVPPEAIFLTGHPLVETVNDMLPKLRLCTTIRKMHLEPGHFVLLTLHRAETVDNMESLSSVVDALEVIEVPVIFPVHPRTKLRLKQFGLLRELSARSIRMIRPCSYVSTLSLIAGSAMVLTDSGGVQQECALLKTPCVTLRARTEWIETVEARVNYLASPVSGRLESVINMVYRASPEIRKRFSHRRAFFGDGMASGRIVGIVTSRMVEHKP